MELTILMPCLNEAETILHCIHKAKHFIQLSGIQGEILIADNGSSDNSKNLALSAGAKVIQVSEKGYGAALIAGIAAAQGTYIIMGDADDSYDFSCLQCFLQKFREGYDLVMGNRFKGTIKPGAMPFLNQYLGNPLLSFLGKLFFKVPIGDFHCGLRGIKKSSAIQLQLQASGMEFASEMVIKAALSNISMTEIPIVLSPDGRKRPPHLRRWRDGWRHLVLMLYYSPKKIFIYAGIFLLSISALIAWLIIIFKSLY